MLSNIYNIILGLAIAYIIIDSAKLLDIYRLEDANFDDVNTEEEINEIVSERTYITDRIVNFDKCLLIIKLITIHMESITSYQVDVSLTECTSTKAYTLTVLTSICEFLYLLYEIYLQDLLKEEIDEKA